MSCPHCQGLIIREYQEERCLNCGHRTAFVPPPAAVYRPLPEGFVALPVTRLRPAPTPTQHHVTVPPPAPATPGRRRMTPEERREKRRIYMRQYMRAYNQRPGARERANAAHRAWKRRTAASDEAPC
ncbi:MAG: hypothetical protein H8K10_15580 [Nitrospira sp.]|nr:hypothetical protein [Nitrospira sp.]